MLLVLLETPEIEGQEIGCGKALSALINTSQRTMVMRRVQGSLSTLVTTLLSTPNNTLLPWGHPDRSIIEDSLARTLYSDFKF